MIKVDEDFTMDVIEDTEQKPQIKREPLDESLVDGGWIVLSETEPAIPDINIKKESVINIKVEPDSQEMYASVPNENLIKTEPESLESNNSLDNNVCSIKTENDLGGTNMSPSNPTIQTAMDTPLVDLTFSEDPHVSCNKKSAESNIKSECHLKESSFRSFLNDHSNSSTALSGRPTVIKINDRCTTNNAKIKEEILDVYIIDLTEDSHLSNNPCDNNCGAHTGTKINIISDKVINLNPEQTRSNNLSKSDLKESIQGSTVATPRNLNSETIDTNIHCSKSLDNNILKNNISDSRSRNPLPAESTNRKRRHSSQEDLTGSKERNNQTKKNVSKVISIPKPDISQMYLYAPPKKPRKDDRIKLNQNEKVILSKIEAISSNLKRNRLEKSISDGEVITSKTAPEERNSNRNREIFHSDVPQTEGTSTSKLQESITNKEKGTQSGISKKGSSNSSKKEDKKMVRKIVNGTQILENTDLSRNRERDESSKALLNKNNDTSSNNVKTLDKSSSVSESKQENNKRIVKLLKCFLQERNTNEMEKIGAMLKELLDREDSDNEENPGRVSSNESPPEVVSNGETIKKEPEDSAIDYSMKERLVNVDKSVSTESVKINSLTPNMTSVSSFSREIISPTPQASALERSDPSEKSKNSTKVAVVNKQNSIANELAKKNTPLPTHPLPASSVSSHPSGKILPPNSSSAFASTAKKESFRNAEAIKNRKTQIVNKSAKEKVSPSTNAPSLSSQMAPKKNLHEFLSKSKGNNLSQRRDNETIKESLGSNNPSVSNSVTIGKNKNILSVNASAPTFHLENSSNNVPASKDMTGTPRKRQPRKERSQDAKRILDSKKETSQRNNEAVNKKPQYRQRSNVKDKNSVATASSDVKISCSINREVAKENLGSSAEPEKDNLSVSAISAEIQNFLSKNEISITLTQRNCRGAENKKKPPESSNCDRSLHLNPPKNIPNREKNKQLDQAKIPNSNRPKQNSKRILKGKDIENKTDTGSANVKTSIKKPDTTSSRKIASNLHLSVRNLPSNLRKNIVDAFSKASSSALAQVCQRIDAMIEDSVKSPKEKTQPDSADSKSSNCNLQMTSATASSSLTSTPQAYSLQTSASVSSTQTYISHPKSTSSFQETATASSNMIRKRQEVQHPSGSGRVSAKANVDLNKMKNRRISEPLNLRKQNSHLSRRSSDNYVRSGGASSHSKEKEPRCSNVELGAPSLQKKYDLNKDLRPLRENEGKERYRNNEYRAPQISKEKFTNSKNVENRNGNKKEEPRCLNYELNKSLPDNNNSSSYSVPNVPRPPYIAPDVHRREYSMSSNTRPGVPLNPNYEPPPKRRRISDTNTRKNIQNGRNINPQPNVQEVLMPQYSWNDLVLPAGGTLQIPEQWQNMYNYNLACWLLQQRNQ